MNADRLSDPEPGPRRARRVGLLALAVAIALVWAPVASAQLPCQGGEQPQLWPVEVQPDVDPSRLRSFELDGWKVNVLLPPGYDEGGERYPVLYVLHGGGWGEAQGPDVYLAFTGLEELSARGRGVIVVMPYGGTAGFYSDWADGGQRWKTFHLRRLIPAIDARFRTLAERAYRAVAGESMGGYGAIHYAARHPDLFAAAGSFMGAVDIWFDGGAAGLWQAVLGPANAACLGGRPLAPWGNPATDEVEWHNHNPVDIAPNPGGVSLYAASASGVPCDADDVSRYPHVYPTFEPGLREMHRRFEAALEAARVPHTSYFRDCGTHDFPYVDEYLAQFWAQMLASFGAAPPASFDYRAADRAVSVWGWSFRADRRRAAEFLDIRDASGEGVTLTGSGTETVTTAPYFAPGATVGLTGAREPRAAADADGRITFTVDLGPPHPYQQYTAQARLAGQDEPGYFKTRAVAFGGR
jgi:S-formylglutathione hydrolase FrmB